MNISTTVPFAVTMGDPAGIGPEIIAKMFLRQTAQVPWCVVGDALAMQRAFEVLGAKDKLHVIGALSEARWGGDVLNVLAVSCMDVLPQMGQVSAECGRAAYDAIIAAIKLARAGQVGGIVTAPLHKEALAAAGLNYPGHTEILAEHGGSKDVAMMLANEELRVVLVTTHCALHEVPERADYDAQMRAIRLAHSGAEALGIGNPRIAVAGLNPHAGEGGLFGDEERKHIIPAIEAARAGGIDVTGPWPGDTVFMRARKGAFDVVVAQYHDQGLIPVKYMGVEQGVNITLGLPFVRTSPDHGTAFDIAGQGIADPGSLECALRYAVRLHQVG